MIKSLSTALYISIISDFSLPEPGLSLDSDLDICEGNTCLGSKPLIGSAGPGQF